MKQQHYYWAGFGAFIIWGFIPMPLRNLTDFASGQILYFRMLISLVALALLVLAYRRAMLKETWQLFKSQSAKIQKRDVAYLLLGTALLTINWLSYIYVINHVDIQTGSFAYLVCPILASLFGFLILKEPLNNNQWIAIGLSALSCGLIGVASWYSLSFSLFIGGTYALYMITQRVLRLYDKVILLALQLVISFTLIAPFYTALAGEAFSMPSGYFWLWTGILAIFFTVLPLFLNLLALKGLPSGVVGIIMYVNPLLNFVVAYLFYGEKTSLQQFIAYLIIIGSIVLYNTKPKEKARLSGTV